MYSSSKQHIQLNGINNIDVNKGIHWSECSFSPGTSGERTIDLLQPRLKIDTLATSDRSKNPIIPPNKSVYRDDAKRRVGEEISEDESEEEEEEDLEYKNKEELRNKVVRRKSCITSADFQLRRSQIERLFRHPDEDSNGAIKNRSDFMNDKNNKQDTYEENINGYKNLVQYSIGEFGYSDVEQVRGNYSKRNESDLRSNNTNRDVDKLLLASFSRQRLHDQILTRRSQLNFKCSKKKISLTRQLEENQSGHNNQQTNRSQINLLTIHKTRSTHALRDKESNLSTKKKSLLSKSRSQSEIETSVSSCYSSNENLICDKGGAGQISNKRRSNRKRNRWTVQRFENKEHKSDDKNVELNIMYCGDNGGKPPIYSKYGIDLRPESLLNHSFDPKDKEMKRVFPFEATPSGNLKVGPKQVVFESKKVSVLVADPQRTKVNVKADVNDKTPPPLAANDHPAYTCVQLPPVTRDLLSRMPPIPSSNRMPPGIGGLLGRADGEFPNLSPPVSYHGRSEENSSEEETRGENKKQRHIPEMNLSRMGYSGKDQIDWSKITLPLKSDLHKLLHNRISNYINPDFIVQIGENEYRCHLLVLQCYSKFFEDIDKSVNTIDLSANNITSDAFESLYTWMLHLGQDSYQLLRRDNILEMFMAAQFLGVKELEEQCWAFIDNEELFSEDTAFLLYLDARRLGHTAVMELMVPRIQRFFLTLVSSKDWLDLHVDEVTVFLRSNYICIHCEMEVFMSGVRWLMSDWSKRNVHLVDIMHCVRFGLIAPWQLVDIRRNPESPEFIEITKDADVQRMVEDGLAFAIIKYWYGHESADYSHWIDLLGLSEPASRNWAGTEKNYLMYKEFLADLENYRVSHSKALSEKKKSKSQLDDSDSLDEDVATREKVPVISASLSLNQANNRKNHSIIMQPSQQLQSPPIPSMIDFITRRGDQNVAVNRVQLQDSIASKLVLREASGKHCVNHSKKSKNSNHKNKKHYEEIDKEVFIKYKIGNIDYNCPNSSAKFYETKLHKNDHYEDRSLIPKNSSTESSDDDCRNSKYNHRQYQKRDCDCHCHSTLSSEDKIYVLRKCDSSPLLGNKEVILGKIEYNNQMENRNENIPIKDNHGNEKMNSYIGCKSLKTKAAIIIESVYRGYRARKIYRKLLDEKLNKNINNREKLKQNEINNQNEIDKDNGIVNDNDKRDMKSCDNTCLQFHHVLLQRTPVVENDTKDVKDDENGETILQLKEEKSKVYKKLLPENVNKEIETQIQTQKNNEINRRKDKELLQNEVSRCEQETKEEFVKDCIMPISNDKLSRTDTAISKLSYNKKNETSSRTSLPRPVRIGTMPAEYLMPGSLFLSNKEVVLVFGGIDPHLTYDVGKNNGKSVYRYIQDRKYWDLVEELPEPRHDHAVTFFKGKVYLIGGACPRNVNFNDKSEVMASVYSFDPVSRGWAIEPSLNIPRKNFGLVACSGKLYAIGGENNHGRLLASVECYCPKRRTWEEVAPLNHARMGLAATKYRDTIWVAGGYATSRRSILSRTVECYDQRSNKWHMNARLRIPRSFTSLFVMNDTLYLIGGLTTIVRDSSGNSENVSVSDVDVWDDRRQEWKFHSQLAAARHTHSVCYLGTSILVVGGVSSERMCTLSDVESRDIQKGAWVTRIPELPIKLSGHGSITLPPASLL